MATPWNRRGQARSIKISSVETNRNVQQTPIWLSASGSEMPGVPSTIPSMTCSKRVASERQRPFDATHSHRDQSKWETDEWLESVLKSLHE